MTTNTLAAIRERADTLEALNWREEDFDAYRYLPQTHDDLAALLAIVDALTARAEAAEAALDAVEAEQPEPPMDGQFVIDGAWYSMGNSDDVFADGMAYARWQITQYVRRMRADALAAHDANGESAGNGGA